jgi:hypothetical protein
VFTILAHGVKNADSRWSIAQRQLMDSQKPVRICSAPTGAGKTTVFFEIAKTRLVFFVVPTQALAKNIEKDAKKESVNVVVWDFNQTQALGADERVWVVRHQQFEEMAQSGGMIICTLEILARLTFGKPLSSGMPFQVFEVFSSRAHIVFDEAHTLNARAFGLVHLWILLVCIIHHHGDEDKMSLPKLNLLSATHSNVFAELKEKFAPEYQPYIEIFDEEIEEKNPGRWIHGEVEVIWQDASLLDTVTSVAAEILARGERLLLIYDSLYQFARDEKALAKFFRGCGLEPEREVFAINAMDKKAGITQGGGLFPSGLEPEAWHRVIIGTSAVEMGVNFRDVNHAIIEHGMDAATLLQRIGRVARSPDGQKRDGKVYVCRSAWAGKKQVMHVAKLQKFNGKCSIDMIRQELAPLREIPFEHAQRLGGTYWSMLTRQHPAKGLIWDAGVKAWRLFSGDDKANPCDLLNQLHKTLRENASWKDRHLYAKWLDQVDKSLQDVRGFAPTVKLQFADHPVIDYEEDWVMKNMIPPDAFEQIDGNDVFVYRQLRDKCLLDKKRELDVAFFSPVGTIHCKGWNLEELQRSYLSQLKKQYLKSSPGRELVIRFIALTGLLARDARVEKGNDFAQMVL